MIKILYNQKQTWRILLLGLATSIIGIASQYFKPNYLLAGFIGLGLAYIATFFNQRFNPYVLITKDFVKVDGFFSKKIPLKDITDIKYFAGDYIIKSKSRELVIDTNTVDKQSLPTLQKFIEDFSKK